MTKPFDSLRNRILIVLAVLFQGSLFAQEDAAMPTYKNQVSTNLLLPIFNSVDLAYERTLGRKFALGIAGAVYGDRIEEISFDDAYRERELKTNYEIMPFARLYFNGNQHKSHFIEIFGSISGVDESGRLVRSVNDQGYGVYGFGTTSYTRGGLGGGYGYRFLFLDGRLAAEAQFGLRTNFDVNFILLNGALVRTGIKIGYRF
ncbi:MAG: hypothetical protein WBG48_04365 [Pricia sp.]